MRKRHASVAALLTLAIAAAGHWLSTHPGKAPSAGPAQTDGNTYHVTYVYDGDTIKLNTDERVRLIGIDTPESHPNPKLSRDVEKRHISQQKQLAMGKKAAAYTRALVGDKDVRLEFDVERRDRYQRLLAYVYLTDGTFVNEKIIREGYAYPLTIPPNVRHAEDFKRWFDEAREQKRGLWQ